MSSSSFLARRVGIIGPAGRDQRLAKADAKTFESMVENAAKQLKDIPGAVCLVSGGAAWSDHVAVHLYLRGFVGSLELCLPCPWVDGRFWEGVGNDKNWRTNPGALANLYHERFSKQTGLDSLGDLAKAQKKGAVFHTSKGFHQRNTKIAGTVERLYAFSFDAHAVSGGTKNTWDQCKCNKKILLIKIF